jgi:hypothetical protein
MTMPTWALERFIYWTMFALLVRSFERLGRNMNWNILEIDARSEKAITAIAILGIVVLSGWVFFHL